MVDMEAVFMVVRYGDGEMQPAPCLAARRRGCWSMRKLSHNNAYHHVHQSAIPDNIRQAKDGS
jgi:hypothetical protein